MCSGIAVDLAGVASANKVNCSGILCSVELTDVGVDGNTGEVAVENSLAIFVNFTESNCSHTCSAEAEGV